MLIPKLGDRTPLRGNRFSRWLGRMLMRLCRWRIEGNIHNAPRLLFVMAPHTSWWDFTNNFGVYLAMGFHVSWFIANTYTKGPVARVLAFFGAVPVERNERSDMVSQMTAQFQAHDQFLLAIFPEGTRKPVPKWKTGFWHIAKKAQVPVQLVAVDYAKRATVFDPVMQLSEDMEKDIQTVRAYFKPVTAKNPENARYTD